MQNYANASMYYLKGEKLCGDYGAKEYKSMSQTLRNAIITESDNARKKLYTDTLLGVYDAWMKKDFMKKLSLQNVPLIL